MKRYFIYILVILAIYLLPACSPGLYTIPDDIKLGITFSKEKSIGYSFIPNRLGDHLTAKVNNILKEFSVNAPLDTLMRELYQIKFGTNIVCNKDMLTVNVTDIRFIKSQPYNLEVTIEVILTKDGVEYKKSFTYSYSGIINMLQQGHYAYQINKMDIQNLMLKFVIDTDKFINQIFEIKQN